MTMFNQAVLPAHYPFLTNKYTVWYYNIIYNARNRTIQPGFYYEKHHIIPESMFSDRSRKGPAGHWPGNPNDKENIVYLTAREHFVCHLLLTKMTTDSDLKKMIRAAWKMCFSDKKQKRTYRITSRTYSVLRFAYADIQSKQLKGKPGRPQSDATKLKLSAINKGKKLGSPSLKTREKISLALKGRSRPEFSKEWCKKLSDANKNKAGSNTGLQWWNDGNINKMSIDSPGDNWTKGQLKQRVISKGSTGMSWWNNGEISKLSMESPGTGWIKGRLPLTQ